MWLLDLSLFSENAQQVSIAFQTKTFRKIELLSRLIVNFDHPIEIPSQMISLSHHDRTYFEYLSIKIRSIGSEAASIVLDNETSGI